jgi:hypothetical protein
MMKAHAHDQGRVSLMQVDGPYHEDRASFIEVQ